MKVANRIIGLAVLVMAQLAQAQLGVGENTKLTAGGLASFGYAGDYGDAIPSSHGLNFGLDGKLSGYYYNPNFISFSATPYYNQSRSDSSSQSITGASGIDGTVNFFTGSNFAGSVTYRHDSGSPCTCGLGVLKEAAIARSLAPTRRPIPARAGSMCTRPTRFPASASTLISIPPPWTRKIG